jgi:hypothetical protein
MASFTPEKGKVYYFRERVCPGSHDHSFDLDSINNDEGKYLVASSVYSVSPPRSKQETAVLPHSSVISRVDATAGWRLRFSLLADDTGIIQSILAKQL